MTNRWRKTLAAVFAAVTVAVTGCSAGGGDDFSFVSPDGQVDIYYEGEQRQKLPELAGEDLFDPDKRIAASDFEGQVLVINLWGQWCGPCRAEAPELQKLYEETKDDGVAVLGIDVREHDRSAPQDFVRDRGLTYPSIYDPSGRSLVNLSGYPRTAVPSTIVVDRQGRVAAVFLRALLASDLRPLVDRLVAEEAA
ncbi:TlpA disulfide reductase family protein [Saccharomonospora sp.]|uniref:TlpA family protein disulfide reductase n=1 Tax=Saccharomonospora sp. TaxID=33913 RepID=UPI0026180DFA|nr:TlpA disulfide reductase family protein [Saccharomonospora sp.]